MDPLGTVNTVSGMVSTASKVNNVNVYSIRGLSRSVSEARILFSSRKRAGNWHHCPIDRLGLWHHRPTLWSSLSPAFELVHTHRHARQDTVLQTKHILTICAETGKWQVCRSRHVAQHSSYVSVLRAIASGRRQ